MDNIIVRNTNTFQELKPKEGYVITNWDGEDIINFTYSTLVVCPLNYEHNYYTITNETAEKLETELEQIMIQKEQENNA